MLKVVLPLLVLLGSTSVHSKPFNLDDCGPQVCASYGGEKRVFTNMCELLNEIETTGVDWNFEELNECSDQVRACTKEYDPVCGFAGFEFRTFPNECIMDQESEETGIVWQNIYSGECEEFSNFPPSPVGPPVYDGTTGVGQSEPVVSPPKSRFHNNVNNTFNAAYVEGNYFNGPVHNYYGIILPPYNQLPLPDDDDDVFGDIDFTGGDYFPDDDVEGVPTEGEDVEEDDDDEEEDSTNKSIKIGGNAFTSVVDAVKYISAFTKELLSYLQGLKGK